MLNLQIKKMNPKLSLFKYWSSFIHPVNITSKPGNQLPKLEVNVRNGKYVLDGEKVNYSFGSLHELFKGAFAEYQLYQKPIKSVLILGFGGGSVANILKNELNLNCEITGVEMDPIVIELAKKYFGANRLDNTEIFCQDAFNFMKNDVKTYDLIVIDLFIEDRVPVQYSKNEFIHLLKTHLNPEGYIFYNRITNNWFNKNETNRVVETMRKEFKAEIDTFSFDQHNTSNEVLIYHDFENKEPYIRLKRKIEQTSI